ncbi:MAG: iron ABC transporter permease, partial [Actinomyces sp.]|nr:iron ABC transporter permease [Actinomyces sp.]
MSVETVAPPCTQGAQTPQAQAVASGKKKRTKVRRDPVTVAIVAIITAVLFLLVLLPLVTILA